MRPSIVSASVKEPYPGWVDNFNGETLFSIDEVKVFRQRSDHLIPHSMHLKTKIVENMDMRQSKTSQELRMLSRALSDCKSLLLNVMIQVSQFIRNGQLCH